MDRIGAPGGTISDFLTSIRTNYQKNLVIKKGDLWREKNFRKKVLMPKQTERGPFSLPGTVSYTEKRDNFYISVPCGKLSNLAP